MSEGNPSEAGDSEKMPLVSRVSRANARPVLRPPGATIVKSMNFAVVFAVVLALAKPAPADEDSYSVHTEEGSRGNTVCDSIHFSNFAARAPVVQGRTANIRIERHFVDLGLERASVESCAGNCSATITRKGNFEEREILFGGHPRKGFVELDLQVQANAPPGNAKLVLHYFGGGRGEYNLVIVRGSRADAVDAVDISDTDDQIVIHGTRLDRLENQLSSNLGSFTRIGQNSTTLIAAPSHRTCQPAQVDLRVLLAANSACHLEVPFFSVIRDPDCPPSGGPPHPYPGPPPPPVSKPNLLPALASPLVLSRPLGNEIATTRGGMFQVNMFFCSGLPVNSATTVNVPKLSWGVQGVNIEAANMRFAVQLLDTDSNRVLDTLTLPLGFPANTPLVERDNYPGRAGTIRVILDPRFQRGSTQQTVVGCFTDPGNRQTLDPKNLLIRVDPDNSIDEGNRENDNDLRF